MGGARLKAQGAEVCCNAGEEAHQRAAEEEEARLNVIAAEEEKRKKAEGASRLKAEKQEEECKNAVDDAGLKAQEEDQKNLEEAGQKAEEEAEKRREIEKEIAARLKCTEDEDARLKTQGGEVRCNAQDEAAESSRRKRKRRSTI